MRKNKYKTYIKKKKLRVLEDMTTTTQKASRKENIKHGLVVQEKIISLQFTQIFQLQKTLFLIQSLPIEGLAIKIGILEAYSVTNCSVKHFVYA